MPSLNSAKFQAPARVVRHQVLRMMPASPMPVDANNYNIAGPSPYSKYYHPHADIWKFYLEEAQAKDKELMQFWQFAPDSLLVFVSGIVQGCLAHSKPSFRPGCSLASSRRFSSLAVADCSRILSKLCSKRSFRLYVTRRAPPSRSTRLDLRWK